MTGPRVQSPPDGQPAPGAAATGDASATAAANAAAPTASAVIFPRMLSPFSSLEVPHSRAERGNHSCACESTKRNASGRREFDPCAGPGVTQFEPTGGRIQRSAAFVFLDVPEHFADVLLDEIEQNRRSLRVVRVVVCVFWEEHPCSDPCQLLLAAPRRSLRDAEVLHVGDLVIAIVRDSMFCLFGKRRMTLGSLSPFLSASARPFSRN